MQLPKATGTSSSPGEDSTSAGRNHARQQNNDYRKRHRLRMMIISACLITLSNNTNQKLVSDFDLGIGVRFIYFNEVKI